MDAGKIWAVLPEELLIRTSMNEGPMDISRCPKCKKRLITMTSRTGPTRMVCLKCDNIDPMKTDVVKWAYSDLADLGRPERS